MTDALYLKYTGTSGLNTFPTTTIDLRQTGLFVESGSWRSVEQNGIWTDSMSLVISNPAGMASTLQLLESVLGMAAAYAVDDTREKPVWLYWQSGADAAEKRALVLGGTLRLDTRSMFPAGAARAVLVLERGGWESTGLTSSSAAGISATGGKLVTTRSAGAGGRIERIRVTAPSGGVAIEEVWVGLRGMRGGSQYVSNPFEPTLDLKIGALSVDATQVSDSSAVGGDRIDIDFASSIGLVARAYADYYYVSALYYGRYLVLVRYKSADTASGVMQVRFGTNENLTAYNEVAYVAADNWRLLPLATIDVPLLRGNQVLQDAVNIASKIWIYASQTGSGDLHLDSVVLVPTDVMVYMNGANIVQPSIPNSPDSGAAHWLWSPDGGHYALTTNAASVPTALRGVDYSMSGNAMPVDGWIAVVAGQRSQANGGSNINDMVDLLVEFYIRYGGYA